MVVICKGYKTTYNPPKTQMEVITLEKLSNDVKLAIDSVVKHEIAVAKATNQREIEFNGIKKLSTRILLAAKACMVTPVHFNDLVTINRKIQGRKSAKVVSEIKKEGVLLAENAKKKEAGSEFNLLDAKKRISSTQQSFNRNLDNFGNLIELLKATPEYKPNEADLKVNALADKLALMKLANEMVVTAQVDLVNARIERNQLMYLKENNLVDTAFGVKNYIRSVFGAKSVLNKNLVALKFNKPSVI
ncbi:MAG: hypothetical protein JHD28_02745 [Bacteroidia bacterium]|nr:hypothetical protein [Bacteroidia bacterium]